MNEPYDPIDELHFDGEQSRRLDGFSEMEQRLRQFQPRLPRADMVAIEQAANEMNSPVPAASTIIQGVDKKYASRFAGTIASSWMCGVAVGAACVFFFMSNQKQPVLTPDASASNDVNQEGPMEVRSGIPDEDSTIRWRGRYVKTSEWLSHSGSSRERGRSVVGTADSTTDTGSFSNSLLSQFSPPQPVTRAELMRELLNPFKEIH